MGMASIFTIISCVGLLTQSYVLTLDLGSNHIAEFDTDNIAKISIEELEVYPISEDAKEVPENYFKSKLAPMPLPSTLEKICKGAFEACMNDVVVIPEGVEVIESRAFFKGYRNVRDEDGFQNFDVPGGNLNFVYIPKSVKSLGEGCFNGILEFDEPSERYVSAPAVVMEAETPPEGFSVAFYTGFADYENIQKLYVPEEGVDSYTYTIWAPKKNQEQTRAIYGRIQLNSYKPVSVSIDGGDKQSNYTYNCRKLSDNKGEIKSVRWAVSDESIASISNNGVLRPLKTGKTYVQCIVSTPASDGKDIEFYFFKPVEVTAEMLNL